MKTTNKIMNEREAIILGALLHDIGKMMQRAKLKFKSSTTEAQETLLCLFDKEKNYYIHRHVLWTWDFFEAYWPKDLLRNIFPQIDIIKEITSHHHNPLTETHKLLQKADWISAAVDSQPRPDDDPYIKDA